jgi:transposase
MLAFRFTISTPVRKLLQHKLKSAQRLGNCRLAIHILAILAVADGHSLEQASGLLKVSTQTLHEWLRLFLIYGIDSLNTKKPSGRPAKLTKAEKRELAAIIEAGPQAAGFSAACWRSPMIQHLIHEKFGVFYSVHYISQLLKNMGFSYQKARFVSDHLDEIKRKHWMSVTWPEILKLAKDKGAHILFGDEASFPQWGTLTYTWARKGHQPTVKTSGKRKAYKVFGLIDYFTGRLFHYGLEARLNSQSYAEFLTRVLAATDKHIILIQDGAKYHTSAAMKKYFAQHSETITVFQLPAYSPDLNPIEKLWKKIKEQETHLHYFPTYESMINKVEQALMKFENRQEEILALFKLSKELAVAA